MASSERLRRRNSVQTPAPSTPTMSGIDVVFKRRASSVRVRRPSYTYLNNRKPRTHDDGFINEQKVLITLSAELI